MPCSRVMSFWQWNLLLVSFSCDTEERSRHRQFLLVASCKCETLWTMFFHNVITVPLQQLTTKTTTQNNDNNNDNDNNDDDDDDDDDNHNNNNNYYYYYDDDDDDDDDNNNNNRFSNNPSNLDDPVPLTLLFPKSDWLKMIWRDSHKPTPHIHLIFCSSLIDVLRHDAIMSPREAMTTSTVLRRDCVKVRAGMHSFGPVHFISKMLAWKIDWKTSKTNSTQIQDTSQEPSRLWLLLALCTQHIFHFLTLKHEELYGVKCKV